MPGTPDRVVFFEAPRLSVASISTLNSEIRKGSFGSVIASHSVDASTGWRGCSAEIETRPGRAIERGRRSREKLSDVHGATQDIPANQIWIPSFERRRRRDGSSQDAVAELRSETCNLAFNSFHIVFRAAIRDVAVGPCRVLALRSTAGVKERRLTEKHERSV